MAGNVSEGQQGQKQRDREKKKRERDRERKKKKQSLKICVCKQVTNNMLFWFRECKVGCEM